MLNQDEMMAVVAEVQFPGYTFWLHNADSHCYLQASFYSPCAKTGAVTQQKTRKWLISPHATKGEIVQTALLCVLTAVEHEAREQFKYKGRAVFGPHFDVTALIELCDNNMLETRV